MDILKRFTAHIQAEYPNKRINVDDLHNLSDTCYEIFDLANVTDPSITFGPNGGTYHGYIPLTLPDMMIYAIDIRKREHEILDHMKPCRSICSFVPYDISYIDECINNVILCDHVKILQYIEPSILCSMFKAISYAHDLGIPCMFALIEDDYSPIIDVVVSTATGDKDTYATIAGHEVHEFNNLLDELTYATCSHAVHIILRYFQLPSSTYISRAIADFISTSVDVRVYLHRDNAFIRQHGETLFYHTVQHVERDTSD